MKVVAVVPAWEALERLPSVLDALADQVASIVVVDNGSRDSSLEWLSTASVRATVIANRENKGFATAANQGIGRAMALGAQGVLLANDDVVFRTGSVGSLVSALGAEPDAGAATPKMLYRDRPRILNGTGGRYDANRGWAALRGEGEVDEGQYDMCREADYPSGACALLRRSALENVGVFDEDFYLYYEDVDWGLRAAQNGWRTLFVPEAEVLHGGSVGTAGDPARRRYYNVRNRLRFVGRHAPPSGRAYAWLATIGLAAKQPLRYLFPQRRRDAQAVVQGVADHLSRQYGRSTRFG